MTARGLCSMCRLPGQEIDADGRCPSCADRHRLGKGRRASWTKSQYGAHPPISEDELRRIELVVDEAPDGPYSTTENGREVVVAAPGEGEVFVVSPGEGGRAETRLVARLVSVSAWALPRLIEAVRRLWAEREARAERQGGEGVVVGGGESYEITIRVVPRGRS